MFMEIFPYWVMTADLSVHPDYRMHSGFQEQSGFVACLLGTDASIAIMVSRIMKPGVPIPIINASAVLFGNTNGTSTAQNASVHQVETRKSLNLPAIAPLNKAVAVAIPETSAIR